MGRFPASQRVRKRPEFQEIQRSGRRVTTPGFVIILRARADGAGVRLGVTASRRVGGSVVRNRAKRLVREAFRATRDLWDEGLDLVVVVRKAQPDLGLGGVVAEWRHAAAALRRRAEQARADAAARESDLAQRPQTTQTPGRFR